MEEARWGAVCPGMFLTVLMIGVKCSCGLPDTLASSYRKFGHAGEKASTGFIGGIIDSDIKWTPPRKTSRVLVFMQPDKRLYVLS
jgi:hypothetical protein